MFVSKFWECAILTTRQSDFVIRPAITLAYLVTTYYTLADLVIIVSVVLPPSCPHVHL